MSRPRTWWLRALAAALALAGCQGGGGSSGADAVTGAFAGSVTNQIGGPVASVSVTTSPLGLTDVTGSDGRYEIANVPIGVYTVTFSGTGFPAQTVTNTSVVAANTTTVDVTVNDARIAFDALQSICNGLATEGATLNEAVQQTGIATAASAGVGTYSAAPVCPNPPTLFASIGGTCSPQTVENPECEVFFEWITTDPGLCSPQGGCCFICQIRMMKSSTADIGSTLICASRWLTGQLCQ